MKSSEPWRGLDRRCGAKMMRELEEGRERSIPGCHNCSKIREVLKWRVVLRAGNDGGGGEGDAIDSSFELSSV